MITAILQADEICELEKEVERLKDEIRRLKKRLKKKVMPDA